MRSRGLPVSLWTRLSWPNHALIPRSTLALAIVSLSLTCIALSASLLASSFIRSAPTPASPSTAPHGPLPHPRHITAADSVISGYILGNSEILGGMDGSGVEILSGDATSLSGGEKENNAPEKEKEEISGKLEKSGYRWYEWVLGAFASPLGAFSDLRAPYRAEQIVLASGQGPTGSLGSRREGRGMIDAADGSDPMSDGDGGGDRVGKEEAVAGSQEEKVQMTEEVEREQEEKGEGGEEQETQLHHVMFNIASFAWG
ncbi:unnamed protein product [Closterium sp. Naga37s-1]|nr:unnamed protein product [Closterium sp. Naga37s-1]